jgi:hypothetical protein
VALRVSVWQELHAGSGYAAAANSTINSRRRRRVLRRSEINLAMCALGALGAFIDKFGLAGQRFVYTKNFAAYGRKEVARGLDRLDNPDRAAFLHLRADVRELNSSHVAELFLSVVCYSNGSDTVLDDEVL